MLQGLDDYLNEEKVQQIAVLGHNPNMEELEVILSRRIRSEKDVYKRQAIACGRLNPDITRNSSTLSREALSLMPCLLYTSRCV